MAVIESLLWVFYVITGIVVGYLGYTLFDRFKLQTARQEAKKVIDDANREVESIKREALLEAKEESLKVKNDLDREVRERRNDMQRQERRIIQKEETLDRKTETLEKKEEEIAKKQKDLDSLKVAMEEIHQKNRQELERISGLTGEEAKALLMKDVEEEIQQEIAVKIRDMEAKAKDEADRQAREVVTRAIQKCAADHVAEVTVSVVELPSDEMKGRIIGREGRNIRALETLTGIDLIIDDTPEAVILSGFDPVRREVARLALEKLVSDGRIHPARIEEMVDKAQKEVENVIKEEGERATFETGVHGLHPELIKLLGRLKYRTSYGQNVLKHSIEVAQLCGAMAGELGLDATFAKRAGLLHDIGKAVNHDIDGSHVSIGADLAKKYRENPNIVNAVGAHHGDIETTTLEAVLVQAADAVSAARPGARRETLESYIKRLEKLEEIADSFDGVEKAYAIQAGREIRIMVQPDKIDDGNSARIAREIVKRIEEEMEYPGQIKVTVIRETRAVDYAK